MAHCNTLLNHARSDVGWINSYNQLPASDGIVVYWLCCYIYVFETTYQEEYDKTDKGETKFTFRSIVNHCRVVSYQWFWHASIFQKRERRNSIRNTARAPFVVPVIFEPPCTSGQEYWRNLSKTIKVFGYPKMRGVLHHLSNLWPLKKFCSPCKKCINVTGKRKFHPITGHEDPERESRGTVLLFL